MKKTLIVVLVLLGLWIWCFVGYVYSGLKFIPPHFHANFLMYVDGEKIDFSGDKYMEDVAGCSLTWLIYPKDRVHLHENNGETIHIHDEGVSWGHFFANNWFTFGSSYIALDDGRVLTDTDDKSMTFVLNGKVVDNPFNTLIKSKDRLYINYWSEDEQTVIDASSFVSENAWEYNAKYDPGSCGGSNENGIVVLIHEMFNHKH